MKQKAARIKSIKGLGKISAATLLAVLPEIGTLSRKEVAALAGVAPYNRDSGTFRGQRHICGGRKRLRATLYRTVPAGVFRAQDVFGFERLCRRILCLEAKT